MADKSRQSLEAFVFNIGYQDALKGEYLPEAMNEEVLAGLKEQGDFIQVAFYRGYRAGVEDYDPCIPHERKDRR